MQPDGKHFVTRARDEAASWRETYKGPIPTSSLAHRMGAYVQAYTLYSSVRPFGITSIIGGWDADTDVDVDGIVGVGPEQDSGRPAPQDRKHGGPYLYMVEPSGLYWGYYGAATGKGRQAAKAELEKLKLGQDNEWLTLEQGVKEAARIIYIAHEDSKDKDFELEMTWISNSSGPTGGRHEEVPLSLREEAERLAREALNGDDDDDDDDEKMQE